jgi:ribonuclease P protein component
LIGRVRHRSTFTDLRRRGVGAASGPLSVTYASDLSPVDGSAPAPPVPRVAFAVPRRVGNAVARNKVRRRLRAILAEAGAARLPAGAYLVAVRPGADGLSYRELSEHVHRALTEIAKRAAARQRPAPGQRAPGPSGPDPGLAVGSDRPARAGGQG